MEMMLKLGNVCWNAGILSEFYLGDIYQNRRFPPSPKIASFLHTRNCAITNNSTAPIQKS
jgi:hypothetical protein